MQPTPSYPIGTPGQPWGDAERDQWRARQVRQRSHADDVLRAIDALRSQWDVQPYGEVAYANAHTRPSTSPCKPCAAAPGSPACPACW